MKRIRRIVIALLAVLTITLTKNSVFAAEKQNFYTKNLIEYPQKLFSKVTCLDRKTKSQTFYNLKFENNFVKSKDFNSNIELLSTSRSGFHSVKSKSDNYKNFSRMQNDFYLKTAFREVIIQQEIKENIQIFLDQKY